jgi:hypothetical protein
MTKALSRAGLEPALLEFIKEIQRTSVIRSRLLLPSLVPLVFPGPGVANQAEEAGASNYEFPILESL